MKEVKNKFYSLFIPFVAWIFAPYILFTHTFPLSEVYEKILKILKSPDNGYWFLYVLFIIYCLFFLIHQIKIKTKIPYAILTLLFYYFLRIVIHYLKFYYFGIGSVIHHFLFFMAGFICYGIHRKYYSEKLKTIEYGILLLLTIFFICLVRFWFRISEPSFMEYDFFQKGGDLCNILRWTYLTFIPYCGIAFTFLVSLILSNSVTISAILSKLGRLTLEIYVLHSFGLGFITKFGNGTLGIIMNIFFAFVFSIAIIYSLKGCFLSKILFGKFNLKNKKELNE